MSSSRRGFSSALAGLLGLAVVAQARQDERITFRFPNHIREAVARGTETTITLNADQSFELLTILDRRLVEIGVFSPREIDPTRVVRGAVKAKPGLVRVRFRAERLKLIREAFRHGNHVSLSLDLTETLYVNVATTQGRLQEQHHQGPSQAELNAAQGGPVPTRDPEVDGGVATDLRDRHGHELWLNTKTYEFYYY